MLPSLSRIHALPRMPGRRSAAVALACAAAALGLPAPARAGRYHVYACRTPTGSVAPADGWSGSSSGAFVYATNDCASGGALNAALDGSVSQPANTAIATWSYSAPPHATIAAAALWRYGTASGAAGNAADLFWLAAPHDTYDSADVFDQCVAPGCSSKGVPSPPLSDSNMLAVPSVNVQGSTSLFLNASCGGATGYNCPPSGGGTYAALVRMYAADVTLDVSSPPTVANVAGSLASAPTLTGPQDVSFDAGDSGPGLYEVKFEVDGQLVSHAAVDANGGRCQDAGGTSDGTRAFLYGQPCASTAHVQQTFDSRQVADGQHHLVVAVDDAAGNRVAAVDRQVTFSNGVGVSNAGLNAPARGAVNGTNASDRATLQAHWQSTGRPALQSRFGRTRQVVGRLTTADGRPIAGAAVDVLATPSYPGAGTASEGTAHSNPDGTWSFTVPGGDSSRVLDFHYRSHLGDTSAAAAARLELEVHAAITLRIQPHVVSVGRTITFRGRVLGGPIPRRGKQLVLEARQPGGAWIEFNVIRTNAQGRFHARYRFRFPGPVTYQFRVVSKYEAAFPFIAGTSPVVGIRER